MSYINLWKINVDWTCVIYDHGYLSCTNKYSRILKERSCILYVSKPHLTGYIWRGRIQLNSCIYGLEKLVHSSIAEFDPLIRTWLVVTGQMCHHEIVITCSILECHKQSDNHVNYTDGDICAQTKQCNKGNNLFLGHTLIANWDFDRWLTSGRPDLFGQV